MNRLAPLIALAVMSCGQVQDADRRDHASLVDSSGVSVITNFTPRWSDGTGWRVDTVPIVDIGSETGLFSPVSAYRSSDSSIIVADGSQGSNKIMVFDKNGRHLASAGGEGDGPCEFRQLTWVAPLRPDSIIGFDYGAHRISILSSSGQCVRTTKLPTWRDETPRGTYGFAAGADPQLFADGKLLTYPTGSLRIPAVPGPAWYEHKILRVALDGASWDTVGTFRIAEQNWNGSEQTSRPFGAAAFRAVDGSHFLHGVSSTFEFRR